MVEYFEKLLIPKGYSSKLSVRETEAAIKQIKDHFENSLAKHLNLARVSAPLFVRPETGLNDNLNGIERPVAFDITGIGGNTVEIVQSLAKWKRMALKKYGFSVGEGIYTDMNALRRDEELDNLHSVYVDQWDWESCLTHEQRTEKTLMSVVKSIYNALKETETYICGIYPEITRQLPEEIFFITTQELENMYPELTPKERENRFTSDKGAVFVMKIGGRLASGIKHDGRAPDYDDWALNGDIILWYGLLGMAFEISSMGIRVDEETLKTQLALAKCEERKSLPFHQDLLNGRLPYSIGGGIGQSRLCMFFLEKAHIGEVQSSVWPEWMIKKCEEFGIKLL
jgi:aspartate--ammonia ligase